MGEITTYRDLYAWQVGMDVVTQTYKLTANYPSEERFGLIAQMRRAAVSIPSNVAEGQGVKQGRWSVRYVSIAIGSSLELETQLEASVRLQYVSADRAKALFDLLDRVQKLLYGLRRRKLTRIGATVAAGAGVLLLAIIRSIS